MKLIRTFAQSIVRYLNAGQPKLRRPAHRLFTGLERLEVREVLSAPLTETEATLLSVHDGYWVGQVDIPGVPIPATFINDVYVDTEAGHVTVYAQVRIGDDVVSPVQVGPGESAALPNGSILSFHPNAVYLNGSGEELMEADGTGEWWVKHPVLADEGYVNVEVEAGEYVGVYVEGELLENGSIRAGGVDPQTEAYGFNIREVNIDQDPPTYTVTRYRPANIDPAVGEIDLTPVADPTGTFTFQCATGESALDGSVRGCPSVHDVPENNNEVRVGYEIIQVVSPNEMITWANIDGITQEEFDAIELPPGWFKNQPREIVTGSATFAGSPGAGLGEFVEEELYGHSWQHVATIVEANVPLDDDSLLTANTIAKSHQVTFDADSTLSILISPEGEHYVLISRDAGRTSDTPTIPEGWQLVEHTLTEELVVQLPSPTTNIRADNEDSFQGPVPELAALLNDDEPNDGDAVILTTADGVEFVRTPDEYFDSLPDWPYEPKYIEIDGLRQAYVDEGPEDGPVVLLLHGQPSWSYLYRDMIPVLADAGYRVIAMDHLGMGRSDKPIDIESYSFLNHTYRLEEFIQELGLEDINLFAQDWGSVIGLHVAGLNPDWFASITIGNGSLPVFPEDFQPFPEVENPDEVLPIPSPYTGIPDQQLPVYDEDGNLLIPREDNSFFGNWMNYAMKAESFRPSETVEAMTWFDLPPEEEAAYDAPFPSRTYMAGPRSFPSLVNDLPGVNQASFAGLQSYEKPFLTIWAANDPGAQGSLEAQQLWIDNVPGAEGQPHARLDEASHFLQDDQGEEIARRLVEFYDSIQVVLPVGYAVSGGPGASSEIRMFDGEGNLMGTFNPFADAPGGVRVASADMTGDGTMDVVAGTGPGIATAVAVLDGATGETLHAFSPFEPTFLGGVYVASGDLTGDGVADFAVSAAAGGGARVQVFDGSTGAPIADFFGIDDPNFRGGASVAFADVNDDGFADLLIGAGPGGGPRLAVYDGALIAAGVTDDSAKLFPDFFVFEPSVRNGLSVAAGDLTGDGYDDLVVGGGPGAGPRVFALSGADLLQGIQVPVANFFAGAAEDRGGVRVSVKDLNADGRAEIITTAGTSATPRVSFYDGSALSPEETPPTLLEDFSAFEPGFQGGVFVG